MKKKLLWLLVAVVFIAVSFEVFGVINIIPKDKQVQYDTSRFLATSPKPIENTFRKGNFDLSGVGWGRTNGRDIPAILVSNEWILTSKVNRPTIGDTFSFLGGNGNVMTRRVGVSDILATNVYPFMPDIALSKLSKPLPWHVKPLKIGETTPDIWIYGYNQTNSLNFVIVPGLSNTNVYSGFNTMQQISDYPVSLTRKDLNSPVLNNKGELCGVVSGEAAQPLTCGLAVLVSDPRLRDWIYSVVGWPVVIEAVVEEPIVDTGKITRTIKPGETIIVEIK